MTTASVTIPKNPVLPPGADFFFLRREAIACISELGSQQWTDYNTHDSGIAFLESLLVAINDLDYRARWNIRDLLAKASDQAFFTARSILTVEPVTPNDYRRLLIDLEGIRNAWPICKNCSCGEGGSTVKGLYDIQVELESDDVVGDLNDRMITKVLRIVDGSEVYEILVEARFPGMDLVDQRRYEAFLALEGPLSITCKRFMRVKSSPATASDSVTNEELRKYWRNVFYATLLIDAAPDPIVIQDVSIRVFTTVDGKNALTVDDLRASLEEGNESGVVALYQQKQILARGILQEAKRQYHAHRNLDEDLCRVTAVRVGQVAVCAEIDVQPDADLEEVQASVWFAIENYLAPVIPFYSLDELRNEGVSVEEIFNGPPLNNGFIKSADLEAATLRSVIRASDIINLLMDIEGVQSISNLFMTRYDDDGNPVRGVVDPGFHDGNPVFDVNKISGSWLLYMEDGQQPRLYHNLSNFKFMKSGLPFTIDQEEAYDILTQLHGAEERPKQLDTKNDLLVPRGKARNAADISPVQYMLPRTYGVGPDGLPSHVSPQRKAQVRQLQAYLMVFEQILGNAFEQVAHVGDLFSTSLNVSGTYFPHDFSSHIASYGEIVAGLDASKLQRLCEAVPEFLDRRNAFLDHVMARFGLQFTDYALMLTNWKGDSVAKRDLIGDKLAVIKAYCDISSGRARAFNHCPEAVESEKGSVLLPENNPVLKRRIALLLGYVELSLQWICDNSTPGNVTTTSYTLVDTHGETWVQGAVVFSAPTEAAAKRMATDAVLQRMGQASAYGLYQTEDGYRLVVRDESSVELGEAKKRFATVSDASDFRNELIATATMARSIVVEHLLLRPKFPGDAIYKECNNCEEADPWSFRLTIVMPGWIAPYNVDLEWRDFANRTIQEEVPSHLLPKICWVGNDSHEADPCDPIVDGLTKLIEREGITQDGVRPTCQQALECAIAVYQAHASAFAVWYAGKEHVILGRQTAKTVLEPVFAGITAAGVACDLDLTLLWNALQAKLIDHFVEVIVHGYQFTRFEQAWYAWLEEDVRFDWGEEQLVERVHAILQSQLLGSTDTDLCACAADMVNTFGKAFSDWMAENLNQGHELGGDNGFTTFTPPAITLCMDATFDPGAEDAIHEFLRGRYESYAVVSYRLSLLVRMLESLTNTYPAATLHDCDEGGDVNPVRLNQTALGSLSLGASEDVDLVVEPEPGTRIGSAKRTRKRKR